MSGYIKKEDETGYIKKADAIRMALRESTECVIGDDYTEADSERVGEVVARIIYTLQTMLPADVAPVRYEEDGTLWVTVGDCEKVGRVIIKNEKGHFCRVFYMGDGDEEPVRHGLWLEYGENKDGTHNMRCSKCGAGLKSKGHVNSYYTKHKYRYCSNCGAKMDEEK